MSRCYPRAREDQHYYGYQHWLPSLWIALSVIVGVGLLPTACRARHNRPSDQVFEFHSALWVNLHHFLYWNALAVSTQNRAATVALNTTDGDELKRLSPDEKKTWNAAVTYYQHSLARRDLLFDDGMIEIKNRLEDAEASPDLAGVAIPSDLKAVLLKAAPVYRTHFWPRHDNAEKIANGRHSGEPNHFRTELWHA